LVLPVRLGDAARIAAFETFFQSAVKEMAPFTRAVYDRAVQIRATTRFKTPDALHLAVAVEAGCDTFLTNDQQLKQFTGITVEVI
jgi:predicted nucleic acid-binding protein